MDMRIEASTIRKAKKDARVEREIEIAINLLSQGVDINIIINSTGFTEKQVEERKTKLTK